MSDKSNNYGLDGFDHPSLSYKQPKSLKMFNAGIALALSSVLVVGLWSLLWFGVAGFAKKQILNWVAIESSRGNSITFEKVQLSGYPGKISLSYKNPKIQTAATTTINHFSWQGEQALISIKPWAPWQGEIALGGKTSMAITTNDRAYNFVGSTEKFNLVVNPGGALADSIKLDIAKLNLVDGVSNLGLKADEIKINITSDMGAGNSSAAIKITTLINNMVMPWGANMPISNHVQFAAFSGKVSGPLEATIADWRDNGGKIIIDSVVLHGNPLALSGSGNVYLDENMQPAGRLTAKIIGLLPTINRFRDVGLIRDSDAVVAKMTLAALSQKTSDGRSFLNLGVEVKENIIYLGPIAIAKLPSVTWQ